MSNNQSPQIDLELKGGHWHWRLTGDSFSTAFEGRARSAEEAAATAEHTLQMARLQAAPSIPFGDLRVCLDPVSNRRRLPLLRVYFGAGVVGCGTGLNASCGADEPEPVLLGGVRAGWLLVAVGEETLLAAFV